MTIHAGVYPQNLCAFLYNTATKKVDEISLCGNRKTLDVRDSPLFPSFADTKTLYDYWKQPNSNFINNCYKKITAKFEGEEFGCVSIVLEKFDNATRKSYFEIGLKYGFQNVDIIDATSCLYLSSTFYSNFVPKDNDVIWIIMDESCDVWEKQNGVAKFIGSVEGDFSVKKNYKNLFQNPKFGKSPNAVVSKCRGIDIEVLEDLEQQNKAVFIFHPYNWLIYFTKCKGSLLHARLMANDNALAEYAVERLSDRSLTINLRINNTFSWNKPEEKIIEFQSLQSLPQTCLIKIKRSKDQNEIGVNGEQTFHRFVTSRSTSHSDIIEEYAAQKLEETFPLPKCDDIQLNISIDINGIYTVNAKELLPDVFENIDKFIDAYYLKSPPVEIKNLKVINLSLATEFNADQQFCISKPLQENLKCDVVGIDFGTERCRAAIYKKKNGRIETIPLEEDGDSTLSSYVAFYTKDIADTDNDPMLSSYITYGTTDIKSGKKAKNLLTSKPKSVVFDLKQVIGKTFEILTVNKNWTFGIADVKAKIQTKGWNGKIEKSPEEISAALLEFIKQKLEAFQGKKLNETVITVPAAFFEEQINGTKEAGAIAGWEIIHILPEPVAAAFAYFMDRPIPNNSTLLLFDLGGGTLDVCLFKILNGEIEIISRSGNPYLGGRDFDKVLIDYFTQRLEADYQISVTDAKKYKLMLKCQEIKHNLSVTNEDKLDVEDINPSKEGYIKITRNQFEKLCEELQTEIKENILKALKKIQHSPNQMDKVLYVGGGCRMPMIANLLKSMFSQAEHCCEEHPDEVVAIGAAYYAFYLKKFKATNTHTDFTTRFENQSYTFPAHLYSNDENIDAIGIDLGTSRCCAAVSRKHAIQTAPLDNTGERLLPSYVAFDEEHTKCGQIVINRLQNYANSTVFDSKRLLGKTLKMMKMDSSWTFGIADFDKIPNIYLSNSKEQQISKHSEEIAAVLFKQIKEKASEFQKIDSTEAVVAIPTGFSDSQKEAIRASALIAGWKSIHLIYEPVAALFAYFIDQQKPLVIENGTIFLIFNLGAVTADVCVLHFVDNQFKSIGKSCNFNCGGKSVDQIIYDFLIKQLQKQYNITIFDEAKKIKLMQISQIAKHCLTTKSEYNFNVKEIDATKTDCTINITRKKIESLSSELLHLIEMNIYKALNEAKCTVDQIDKVLYLGGGCRMPMIKNFLQNIFQQKCEKLSDDFIAIGAAFYAFIVNSSGNESSKCSIM